MLNAPFEGNVPAVLSRGGTWRWGEARTEWRFELGDMWSAPDVANITLVPFVGEQVIVIKTSWGYSESPTPQSGGKR